MDTSQPTIDTPEQTTGISRRTIVAGAAWAVPAIVATTATPAFAAASGNSVTLTPDNYRVARDSSVIVRALVRNATGTPLAGQAVTFTGPSGSAFSPSTVTTGTDGKAVTYFYPSNPNLAPGSTLIITATAGGASGSATLTALGANASMVGSNNFYASAGATTLTSFTPLKNAFPSPITSVAAGGNTAYALLQNGTVWAVGSNVVGQLGNGNTTSTSFWEQIPGLSNVVQIAATVAAGHALLADGSVRSWGRGYEGQLGTGSATNSLTPVSAQGFGSLTAKAIAAGGDSVYALMSDKSIRAWGSNYSGQLGDGFSTTMRTTPYPVSSINTAKQVVAGSANAYALLEDGTVKAWGEPEFTGSGYVGGTDAVVSPVTVQNVSSATAIASAAQAGFALIGDGTVRSWGASRVLGASPTTTTPMGNANVAVTVVGVSGAMQISAVAASAYARLSDGSVKAWGGNQDGQMGNGSSSTNSTYWATTMPGVTNVALTISNSVKNSFFALT